MIWGGIQALAASQLSAMPARKMHLREGMTYRNRKKGIGVCMFAFCWSGDSAFKLSKLVTEGMILQAAADCLFPPAV